MMIRIEISNVNDHMQTLEIGLMSRVICCVIFRHNLSNTYKFIFDHEHNASRRWLGGRFTREMVARLDLENQVSLVYRALIKRPLT